MRDALAGTTTPCHDEADVMVERRRTFAAVGALLSVAGLLAGCSAAHSAPVIGAATAIPTARASLAAFAPLGRAGPALHVASSALTDSLHCSPGLRHAKREPVLLSPGTGVTPTEDFSWNYERRFTAQHRAWCAVTLPYRTQGDIQTAGEYLVHAIRTMYRQARRRIGIVGHSQGGMSMRWALRFWPDTRNMVADVIGLAGDNAGTTTFTSCRVGHPTCTPAIWQQVAGSHFLAALNSGAETFAGIAYTEVFTHTDEVVQPSTTRFAGVLRTAHRRRSYREHRDPERLPARHQRARGDRDDRPGCRRAGERRARPSRAGVARAGQPRRLPRADRSGHRSAAARVGLQKLAHGPGISSTADVRREPPLACYVYAAGCRGR